MSVYNINYSDLSKTAIKVNTGTIDHTTSVGLVGQNAPAGSFGLVMAENFLHLLENFAAPSPPPNGSTTDGQLWYDTTNPSNKVLRINDGTGLTSNSPEVGGIFRSAEEPSNARIGDIWVDTGYNQVYIKNDNGFTLVGPSFSSTSQTGSYPGTILGNDGNSYSVIRNYLNGDVITILAQNSFRPAAVIEGFDLLVPGVNLSTKTFNSITPTFNGLASQASALTVSVPAAQVVSANNFFRKDLPQSLNESLTVNNDGGISIGKTTSTFAIRKSDRDAVLLSSARGSNIVFKIDNNDGIRNNIITISGSSQRVGINIDNPEETLDVVGTMRVSGNFTASNITAGNNQQINGNSTISGNSAVNGISTFSNTIYALSILPTTDTLPVIGASDRKFGAIWVNTVNATTLVGNAGTASRLQTPRTIDVSNQLSMTTSTVSFDGSNNINLSIKLNNNAIDGQISTSTVGNSFAIAITNPATASLYKTTKQDFLSDVTPNLIKPGFVMASSFVSIAAGSINGAPPGWLWCDGASYSSTGVYNTLYTTLMQSLAPGSTPPYGSLGSGSFNVPKIPNITAENTVTTTVLVRYMIKY